MSDNQSQRDDRGAPAFDGKQPKTYGCEVCGAKLSRMSHLQRHRLLHSAEPPETYTCQQCDKQFNRKDVYQRHQRGVHGSNQAARRAGRKKSCQRCIRYKLRCSRELTCTNCREKGAQCLYGTQTPNLTPNGTQNRNSQRNRPLSEDEPMWDMSSPRHMLSIHQVVDHVASTPVPNNDGSTESQQDNCSPSNASFHAPSDACMPSLQSVGGSTETSATDVPQRRTSHYSAVQINNTGMIPTACSDTPPNWNLNDPTSFIGQPAQYPVISGEELHSPYGIQNDGMNDLSGTDIGHHQPFDIGAFGGDMFRASRMDWLGCETEFSPPSDMYSERPSTRSETYQNNEEGRPSNDFDTSLNSTERALSGPYQTLQAPGRTPCASERDSSETWPHVLDRGGNEMWPFDYTSNKGFRKIKLPPLREVLEQTVGHRPTIEETTLRDLIKVLSVPHIPSLNDSPALEALPAVAFLSQLVKVYFAEFHPVLPVVHLPTWRIEKCPTALLAAMACIGATYSTAEGSQEVAALLAEITQRALFWMSQADSTAFRNPAHIAALCFHQIYSLGSGNRRLYEIADASRGLLVTSLRGLGILSSDSEHEDATKIDFRNLKSLDTAALEQAWIRWRDKEIEKRVAWSVFEFDCTLSTLTGKRGAFKIAELPRKLPCSESLWEAHSAKAWASMISFATSPPGGVPLYPLLRGVIAQQPISATVPAWAKRLAVQAISRMLWDLKEIEDASASDILGVPSLAAAHKATREPLLKGLNALYDALSSPTCVSDVFNMNIACLETHYSHLNDTNEAMDLVVFIFRNSSRGRVIPSLGKELGRAKEHLRHIFARKPIYTRRSVCHASSIVSIARECTVYTPCETMRVFMGFAFLLAFAKFFPFEAQTVDNNAIANAGAIRGEAIKLDELPWRRSAEAVGRLDVWVEKGGKASLESVDDICDTRNFEALKQTALKALQDLRVWGLAGKFFRILQNFS